MLIVVINFRTPGLTIDCLRSVVSESKTVPGLRMVIVENGSGDGSARAIRGAIAELGCGAWCDLLEEPVNRGFAGGNNAGIRWAWQADLGAGRPRASSILLLNSDTVVHAGCLAHCAAVMSREPGIGAMSCRLLNADGTLQVVARRFISPLRLLIGLSGLPWSLPRLFGWAQIEYRGWDMEHEPGDPDWIGGAFMLIRTEAIEKTGLLDEDFFFYGEDAEFCFRLRKAGWRIHYDPAVTTTHLGGSSSDPTRMLSDEKVRATWRARYLMLRKCYGPLAMWAVRCADAASLLLRRALAWGTGRADSVKGRQIRQTQRIVCGKLVSR